MNLFETKINYKTYEMLEAMVDLSIEKKKSCVNILGYPNAAELYGTSFSFGRQAGHTTQIVRYIKRTSNQKLVVAGKYNTSYLNRVIKENAIEDRIFLLNEHPDRYWQRRCKQTNSIFLIDKGMCNISNENMIEISSFDPMAIVIVGQ